MSHSQKCLNPLNNSSSSGAAIVQYTCDMRVSERIWIVHKSDGYHTMQFANSNLCMDMPGGSQTWGAQFTQWPCNNGNNQRFTGLYSDQSAERHRVKHSQLCVDVYNSSSTNNAAIIQWECTSGTNQLWKTRGIYAGHFTGYAMGNRFGASGIEVTQGMFANHDDSDCPGDPAAQWSFGTVVKTMDSQSGFHNASGSSVSDSTFTLRDLGDVTCSQGNYWADIYFGRWLPTGDPGGCNCPGSPSPGYCLTGAVNACADAAGYNKPSVIYQRP